MNESFSNDILNREPGRYVTAAEVAKVLGVSAATIFRLARRGKIPHLKVGRAVRFNVHEVQQALSVG